MAVDEWLGSKTWLVLIILLACFSGVYFGIHQGAGQYWDWSFPLYQDHVGNIFDRASSAWVRDALGTPLSYSSDIFVRLFMSLFQFLQPELLLYLTLTLVSTATSYGVYRIAQPRTGAVVGIALGLAAVINPAMFYKFTAGHLNYFVSYAVFVWIVWYFLQKYKARWSDVLICSLLLAFVGAQIQFFAIAWLFVGVYFIYHRSKFRLRHIVTMVLTTILINSIWLSNFIFGANDLQAISGEAVKASFKASNSTEFLNIFATSFANATQIGRFYTEIELLFSAAIIIVAFVGIAFLKVRHKIHTMLLLLLIMFIFLGTGLFQAIQLPVISSFYPMFREVGHFAPIILLFALVLSAYTLPRRFLPIFAILCFLVVGISAFKFNVNANTLNYSALRSEFSEFENLSKQINTNSTPNRILAYPFFSQYSIDTNESRYDGTFPLNNSGHDSYLAYGNFDSVKNAVRPQDFKDSVQYRFLQTHDVNVLQPYGIKYIFDFSYIYESNYDLFVPKTTYDSNTSTIKNDPEFFKKIKDKNGDAVRQISEHVLEITQDVSRAEVTDDLYHLEKNTELDSARNFYKTARNQNIDVTLDDAIPTTGSIANLFNNIEDESFLDRPNSLLYQQLKSEPSSPKKLYVDNSLSDLIYSWEGETINIYSRSISGLSLNNNSIADPNNELLATIKTISSVRYALVVNGRPYTLDRQTSTKKLTSIKNTDSFSLYKVGGDNKVKNGSFEDGLWQKTVGNCNKFDNNGTVSMSVSNDAFAGERSLALTAVRHDACTSADLSLDNNTRYLLEYTAKASENNVSGYYIDFDGSSSSAKTFVKQNEWTPTLALVDVPQVNDLSRLFLYSYGQDGGNPITTNYDGISMLSLEKIQDIKAPQPDSVYTMIDLGESSENLRFTYSDSEYSMTNILKNGDFEQGPWRDRVNDCANYDKSPNINMQVKDGALVLSATKHVACTYQTSAVDPGATYLLRFKYKSPSGSAGYHVGFNDTNADEYSSQLKSESNDWQSFTSKITAPVDATALTLHLYSYELDGLKENRVEYDDVELVKIPPITSSYFIVTDKPSRLTNSLPLSYDYKAISITERELSISNITKPFYVNLKENYSPGWSINVPSDIRQARVNNYSNGWYVDPEEVCRGGTNICTKNSDGSYNILISLRFAPQKWFTMATILSTLTIMTLSILATATIWRRYKIPSHRDTP